MQTERARLIELDEDALVELHTRIRRARIKYVKLYRRQASAKVAEQGGRGKARDALAEQFESIREARNVAGPA